MSNGNFGMKSSTWKPKQPRNKINLGQCCIKWGMYRYSLKKMVKMTNRKTKTTKDNIKLFMSDYLFLSTYYNPYYLYFSLFLVNNIRVLLFLKQVIYIFIRCTAAKSNLFVMCNPTHPVYHSALSSILPLMKYFTP